MLPAGPPAFGPRRGRVVAAAVAVSLLILLATVAAAELLGRPLSDLTREPQNVLRAPVYIGAFAMVVMLLWWSSAAIALFAAALARTDRLEFLVYGCAVAYLVLDDVFQIHEIVLPRLGIDQLVVYAVYGLVFVPLLVLGRGFLRRYDVRLFAGAVAVLALSLGIDIVQDLAPNLHSRFAEQLAKITGVSLLLVFTAGAAAERFRKDAEAEPRV